VQPPNAILFIRTSKFANATVKIALIRVNNTPARLDGPEPPHLRRFVRTDREIDQRRAIQRFGTPRGSIGAHCGFSKQCQPTTL
jgi:hypothetical protein